VGNTEDGPCKGDWKSDNEVVSRSPSPAAPGEVRRHHERVGITAVKYPLMGDDVEEIGLKWWVRYVIVPVLGTVLGGGGLVAIWISMREHPAVTTSTPESSSTAAQKTGRRRNEKKKRNK